MDDISELVSDDDVDELQTSLSNQLQIVDSSQMDEMARRQQEQSKGEN